MHLMTTDPAAWIDPFAEAGADAIIICFDSAADPGAVLEAIKEGVFRPGSHCCWKKISTYSIPIGSYWMC